MKISATNNIAIAGLGQLGRRHLQSILELNTSRNINLVDPSDAALTSAKQMTVDHEKGNRHHKVSYFNYISQLPSHVDVAIIASNSNERFELFKAMVEKCNLKYIIFEKVLFPRLKEYNEAKKILDKKNIIAWVNCPRRMFPEFKYIRSYFYNAEPSVFSANGNMWGLGCNGIHTFDLFAFLTGDKDIQLKNELLNHEVLESKRANYIEFTGTLFGTSEKGNFFQMTSTKNDNKPLPCFYSICNDYANFIIHRGKHSYYDYALAEEGWEWKKGEIYYPYQSELSCDIINELETTGSVSLTPFEESKVLHKELLSAFIGHLDKVGKLHTPGECMVT